jgi:DNA-binding beta-propeller fold protein YncE
MALRSPRFLLACALLAPLAACDAGGGDGGTRDLAAPHDLAVPAVRDLAPGADLGRGDLDGGDEPDGGGGTPAIVHQLAGVSVATLAGSAVAGALDGSGGAAFFSNPVGLALDANGLLYVSEYDGNRIRTVDAAGHTGTVVADVTTPNDFACPFAIAVVSATKLLVQTDCDITGAKADRTGTLWTIDVASGTPTPRLQHLGRPRGLAVLDIDHALVSDHMHHHVDLFDLGPNTLTTIAGALDLPGFADGSGGAVRFSAPYGLAALGGGAVAIADQGNHRLRRLVFTGATVTGATVTTLAGDGLAGTIDADHALSARFDAPKALAVDAAGDIFISDSGAHRIRRVGADGVVVTVAGDGVAGFRDGPGGQARFFGQEGLAVTPDGKHLYVADGNAGEGGPYHRIRAITLP